MSFVLITTGGTIGALPYADPENPPVNSSFANDKRNPVTDYLLGRPLSLTGMDFSHAPLDPRDSKQIDRQYRDRMRTVIENTRRRSALGTHGTDSILETAEYFYGRFPGKAIVLTGAMLPLSNGADSDGFQNLAFSVNQLTGRNGQKPLGPGVYIVLSDYESGPGSKWSPKLYPFTPGAYSKFYDPERGDRSRLIAAPAAGQLSMQLGRVGGAGPTAPRFE